jgi:hypothetical protein
VYSYFDERAGKAPPYSYFSGGGQVPPAGLTPEQKQALLEKVGSRTVQAAELLFDAVDTPASYLRDFLAGDYIGSGTTPGQLLDSYGARPDRETLGGWARPAAEFTAGAVLDPLNLVGVGGLSKAGKVARGARLATDVNLLDDASRVMSRRLIQANELDSHHARNALKSWSDNFGKQAAELSDADLAARPIAGKRSSRRGLTLQDVVEDRSVFDPSTGSWQARRTNPAEIQSLINKIEDQGVRYADVAGQKLTSDLGIGLPFSDANLLGINLPGGEYLARGLDRAGQALRWSGPGRHAAATFSRDVFGAVDEGGQIVGKEVANAVRAADVQSKGQVADILQNLDPSIFGDADTSAAMRRILGGYGSGVDKRLVTPGTPEFRPDLARFVDEWESPGGLAETFLAQRRDAGLGSKAYLSKYSGKYFPRHIDDLSFQSLIDERGGRSGGSGRRGRALDTMTGDQMARKRFLDVPGGEGLINRLGIDPNVAGAGRALQTDADAANYILKQVNAEAARLYPGGVLPSGAPVPKYARRSALKMAQFLHKLDAESVRQQLPIFGSHFTDDFSRYVVGNNRAMATARTLTDLLGSTAKNVPAAQVQGGRHIPLRNAARRLGLRTVTQGGQQAGFAPNLLSRLAARFPGQAQDLKNFSLDERMSSRLTRIADFYDYPEVQNQWIKLFDDYTRVWKGSILAWPARFARDFYSGAFSNAVEVGVGPSLAKGYIAAKHLIQGDMDKLLAMLGDMPKYKRFNPADRVRVFQNDLASSGLLGGRRAVDMADARSALQTGQDVADEFLPGMNPRTTMWYQASDLLTGSTPRPMKDAAYSELGQNWDRFFDMGMKRPRDIGNPILRWSQRLGDTTDSINRAAGYLGLLFKGIDPLEAASRIKLAQVDYSSLTTVEREFFRRFIPFWSFTSRIGAWVGTKVFERPGGRFTQFGLRAPDAFLQSDDSGYVPESIRSSYGMPVSPGIARPWGRQQDETRTWLTDIDLPGIDQINMFKPGFDYLNRPSLTKTGFDTLQAAVSSIAHPAVRSSVEMLTGQNLYTKRPYKDMTPAVSEVAADLLGIPPDSPYGQAIKKAAPVLDLVPFVSRPLQISNRLMDEEKVPDLRDRAYQMGINAFTGVKFQNVSDEARRIDVRRELSEALREDPLVRSFTQPYIPKDIEQFASPELLELMALEREMARESTRARMLRDGRIPGRKIRNTDPMSYFGG